VTEFPVEDLVVTGDPALNVVKTLTVDYRIGGVEKTSKATDPEILKFSVPDDPIPNLELLRGGWIGARKSGVYDIDLTDRRVRLKVPAPAATVLLRPAWQLGINGRPPIQLLTLISWSDASSDLLRYFSGTAHYRTSFEAPTAMIRTGELVCLDLGRVEVMARVKLNGRDLGILWKVPFKVDVTSALRRGRNDLEVDVTNLWPNRLIGDERLPPDSERNPDGSLKNWPDWLLKGERSPTGRSSFAMWRQYGPNDTLLPSGLLGPVRLEAESVIRLTGK
jgi:hypothetical protein